MAELPTNMAELWTSIAAVVSTLDRLRMDLSKLADEEDIDGLPLAMKSAASIDRSASGDDQPRMAMAPGPIIGDANAATTRPRWPRSLPPTDASDQESLHSQLLNAPPLGDGAAYAPEREEAAVTESLGDKRKNMTDCRAAPPYGPPRKSRRRRKIALLNSPVRLADQALSLHEKSEESMAFTGMLSHADSPDLYRQRAPITVRNVNVSSATPDPSRRQNVSPRVESLEGRDGSHFVTHSEDRESNVAERDPLKEVHGRWHTSGDGDGFDMVDNLMRAWTLVTEKDLQSLSVAANQAHAN